MKIFAYAASGFSGSLVSVEVDIRRGIPGLDIVGLPDGAVRESRDRVRVALKRSGFVFPADRILVNLSPADLKKEGAAYDLPIAVGILSASGQIHDGDSSPMLCAGELLLDGTLRPVKGVLPAAAAAMAEGVRRFLVPTDNLREASALPGGRAASICHLRELPELLRSDWVGSAPVGIPKRRKNAAGIPHDMANLRGQGILRRTLEIAVAGGHHLLMFGPPGSGKTMAARALPGLMPDLNNSQSLEVSRIWSLAGKIGADTGLIQRPPFREPHHSASLEGLIGGGTGRRPGEVSLAHSGILFLDEAPEFGAKVVQSIREPLESGRVELARAGHTWWYPAKFHLVMAMNPCPCGNLGREDAGCLCTPPELRRYWRRLGGAILDRIDLRIPVSPVDPEILLEPPGESSAVVRMRIEAARQAQYRRFDRTDFRLNADIPAGELNRYIRLDRDSTAYFTDAVRKFGMSSRAAHGVLRVSRTIADISGRESIRSDDVLEALHYRRFGDKDIFWTTL